MMATRVGIGIGGVAALEAALALRALAEERVEMHPNPRRWPGWRKAASCHHALERGTLARAEMPKQVAKSGSVENFRKLVTPP
jgi:hypothetical protein